MTDLALTYLRFSKASQGRGSSIERQRELCSEYARELGLTIQEERIDKGRSGFTGQNREPDAELGRIEEEARLGMHTGKTIIVEKLDRLSREGPDEGHALLNSLSRAGVSIATVDGRTVYKAGKPLPFEQIMIALIKFHLANDESATKSRRVRAGKAEARRRARDEGRTLTKSLPKWIRIDRAGNRIVIEERADVVRTIFRLADEGMGRTRIVRSLHEQGIAPWGEGKRTSDGWHETFVSRLLRSRAVLGEMQCFTFVEGKRVPDGEPILDYFPPIVDAALFARVNAHASTRKVMMGGRRSEKVANLLSGLLKCASCGGTMRYREKRAEGAVTVVNGKSYVKPHADASLICSRAERRYGGCENRATIPYHSFEQGILAATLHLALDDACFSNRGEIGRVSNLIVERQRVFDIAQSRAERLYSEWSENGSATVKKLAQLAEHEVEEIAVNLDALRLQLDAARGRAGNAEHLLRVANVRGKLHDPDLSVRAPLRRKVAEALQTLIEEITCDADGATVTLIARSALLCFDRRGKLLASYDLAKDGQKLESYHPIGFGDYLRRRSEARPDVFREKKQLGAAR